jgi:hypothetical protein
MVNQFRPLDRPRGLSQWVPRGRPRVLQIATLVLSALVVIAHYALSSGQPATYSYQQPVYQETQNAPASAAYVPQSNSNDQRQQASSATFSDAVDQFYGDLNRGSYTEAYALLSPSFQKSSPYEKWRSGYSQTMSSTPTITSTDDPAVLNIVLTAKERWPQGIRTRFYVGKLSGVQSGESWLIDGGSFHTSDQ